MTTGGKTVQWLRQNWRAGLAWITGAIFIYAASTKIADPRDFSTAIENYRLLPLWLVNPAALFLPWAELAAGAALIFSGWRRAGALLVSGFSCLFLLAVLSAILRGLDIRCGCFGPGGHQAGLLTLALDAALLAAGWLLAEMPLPRIRKSGQNQATRLNSDPYPGPHL